jgi:hypothetical protein
VGGARREKFEVRIQNEEAHPAEPSVILHSSFELRTSTFDLPALPPKKTPRLAAGLDLFTGCAWRERSGACVRVGKIQRRLQEVVLQGRLIRIESGFSPAHPVNLVAIHYGRIIAQIVKTFSM